VVGRYQRVAPAVTRLARSLSANPNLRVRLGPESSASSDEIVCDPRIFQAAYHRNAPVTPDEVALASALHEVLHLTSTHLEDTRPLPADWPIEGESVPDAEIDLLTALERTDKPVAEVLFFSLEDARQEAQNLSIYPGARSVLRDLYLSSLSQAIQKSGALSQFVLGCFLMTAGYVEREVLEKRFEAKAAVALDGPPALPGSRRSDDPWYVASSPSSSKRRAGEWLMISECPQRRATPSGGQLKRWTQTRRPKGLTASG
jgi:hypothetical protein